MPHTKKGELISAGDLVGVEFRVKGTTNNEHGHNLVLVPVQLPYDGDRADEILLNSHQISIILDSAPQVRPEYDRLKNLVAEIQDGDVIYTDDVNFVEIPNEMAAKLGLTNLK